MAKNDNWKPTSNFKSKGFKNSIIVEAKTIALVAVDILPKCWAVIKSPPIIPALTAEAGKPIIKIYRTNKNTEK